MKRKIYAIIKFQFEGIHHYPEASGEEEFLKYPHRHIFYTEVKIEQFHNNRDIEYVNFKRWIQSQINEDLSSRSCEMICEDLYKIVSNKYPNREIEITVLEDGENGSIARFF